MIDAEDVIGICIAYEQGYGQGYAQRKLPNPYKQGSDTWVAWDYGYSEGNRNKINYKIEAIHED